MKEEIICIDDLVEDAHCNKCPNYKVSIYVRKKKHDELMDFLGGKGVNPKFQPGDMSYLSDKLIAIASVVYRNKTNKVLYRKEDKNPTVTAMKFMCKGINGRIYCREIECDSGKIVIICEIHKNKKDQKNKHRERTAIQRTKEYEFDILTRCSKEVY